MRERARIIGVGLGYPDAMSADDAVPDVTLTFGGTATTLLRIGGFTLLTDPNFLRRGQRAYLGKGLWTTRLTDPAITAAQLPTGRRPALPPAR